MKRLFLLLTLSLFTTFVNAQTWAPTGAKWTYGVSYAFSPLIEYREWISSGDTIIDGHACKQIIRNGPSVVGDIADTLTTYEENDVVYLYHSNQFSVLYDFNKNAGETWTFSSDSCNLLITVDSTGIDIINGFSLKTLYVSSQDDAFSGKMIQHIGHVSLPNPYMIYHCTGAIWDADFYTGLRCYDDSEIGSINFGIAPSCDYNNVGIEDIVNPNLNIYPNPTTGIITISGLTDKATATIMDATGRVVLATEVINNKVDVSSLSGGVYVLRIETKNGLSNFRIIKQ